MNLSLEEIRQILSEVLKLLATPEFQTQLEKSRQASANDAVALLQSVGTFLQTCIFCRKSEKFLGSTYNFTCSTRNTDSEGHAWSAGNFGLQYESALVRK